jgi:hypothetical protein
MSGVDLAPETTTGVASPQRANPERTDDASTLAKDLLGVSLVPEITVHSVPDATSPPFINQEGDHGEDNHLGMPQDDNTPVPASRVDIP